MEPYASGQVVLVCLQKFSLDDGKILGRGGVIKEYEFGAKLDANDEAFPLEGPGSFVFDQKGTHIVEWVSPTKAESAFDVYDYWLEQGVIRWPVSNQLPFHRLTSSSHILLLHTSVAKGFVEDKPFRFARFQIGRIDIVQDNIESEYERMHLMQQVQYSGIPMVVKRRGPS